MTQSERIVLAALWRRVEDRWNGVSGKVREWNPFGSGLTDALVEQADGSRVWVSLGACQPTDGKGPLPKREDAVRARDAEVEASLERIRDQTLAEFTTTRWPGLEWGKGLLLKSIDGALEEARARLNRNSLTEDDS